MAWTDEMVEDLKKMWKEGLTTGEIGKRLNVSKNSIVGKVHRLGLSGRPSPIKKKEDENETSAPQSIKKDPALTAAPKAVKEKEASKPAPAKEASASTSPATPLKDSRRSGGSCVSVTDLDNHTCRWPLGDPKDENFHFCGKKVRVGQTYCEEHSAIAYVKPGKK